MPNNCTPSVLDEARKTIDEVDREMAHLFSVRMEAAARIAAFKRERGLPVYDPGREAVVIEKGADLVEVDIQPYYRRLQEKMMELSREYQRALIHES